MTKVSVIILHFGDISTTKSSIESLEKFKKKYSNLIVVNNDPQIDIQSTELSDKNRVLINSGKNLGFAGGVNLGIKHALSKNSSHIAIINNDTSISSDFLSPVLDVMQNDKKIGIAAPLIQFQENGKKQFDYGGSISNLIGRTIHDNRKTAANKLVKEVDYVSGCCMIIKREVFEKIGYFDEKFFLYYEDTDFCLRAKAAGFKVVVVPEVQINHQLSKTVGIKSGVKLYNLVKSGRYFGKKHIKSFPLHGLFMVVQTLIFIYKSPKNTRMILKGWN